MAATQKQALGEMGEKSLSGSGGLKGKRKQAPTLVAGMPGSVLGHSTHDVKRWEEMFAALLFLLAGSAGSKKKKKLEKMGRRKGVPERGGGQCQIRLSAGEMGGDEGQMIRLELYSKRPSISVGPYFFQAGQERRVRGRNGKKVWGGSV